MAFTTIDDGAWTTTDDGPLASCHSVTLRNNAAACSDERVPTTAIVFPADEPLRLCSYFTTCVGPFYIYLPPSEDFETLSVYVQVADVELGDESAGVKAALLYATIGKVSGGWIDRPPTLETPPARPDWVSLDVGDPGVHPVPFQVPDGTIPVANANKPDGWVPVFLWIRSIRETTPEDSGALSAADGRNNSVQLGSAPSPAPSTPPERLMVINPKADDTDNTGYADDHYQWCAYRDDNSEDWAELAPLLPYSGYLAPDASWESYRLGVVLISAITITATPATFEPSEAGYYSAVPAAEQWLNLINRVNRLINERTPQWCCNPGPDSYSDGSHSRLWPMRAGAPLADELDTSYQTLMRTLVVTEPPNDNGYDAIISLVLMRRFIADGPDATVAFPGKITLRLVAYAAGADSPGSAYGSGEEFVIEARALERSVPVYDSAFTHPKYSPARHAIARASDVVDWQLRGHLGSHDLRGVSGVHDWSIVSNIELPPLKPAGLSYPLRVSVEAKINAGPSGLTTTVIGGAIRSRTIGAE